MDFKKYRLATSLVLLMSSFVFAQDVTSSPRIHMNIIDKMSLSVYCGLSYVFDNSNRSKCYASNLPVAMPAVRANQNRDMNVPTGFIPSQPAVAMQRDASTTIINIASPSASVLVPASSTNQVLEEIKKRLDQNSAAIEGLDKRTTSLENRAVGQTIVKYVAGTRGPKGADGVTRVVYATPTPEVFNSLSGSILIGENNQSFADNNVTIGKELVNTVAGSLQIGPNDASKLTIVPGATSGDMSVNIQGRFVAGAFCIDDVCIDKNILKKVVDMFK